MRTGSRPVNPGIDQFCRTLVHEAPDAIVYADVGGMIRFWNRGAERIFGFSASEVLGKSLDMIIPESMRKRHWDAYLETTRTGNTRYGAGEVLAVPALRKDGARVPIEFSILPFRDREGRMLGVAAILRGVTERFEEIAGSAQGAGCPADKRPPVQLRMKITLILPPRPEADEVMERGRKDGLLACSTASLWSAMPGPCAMSTTRSIEGGSGCGGSAQTGELPRNLFAIFSKRAGPHVRNRVPNSEINSANAKRHFAWALSPCAPHSATATATCHRSP